LSIGVAFLVLLSLAQDLPVGATISRWQPFTSTGLSASFGSDLAYYVDGVAFLFAALMAVVALAAIAMYLGHSEYPEGSSYTALLALLAAGFSFVFSANLITLCVSWVIFDAVFLWALAASDHGGERRKIIPRTMNLSWLACLGLLAAALLLGQGDDSLSVRSDSFSAPVFGLILLAALVRVGLYPLHLWIPIGVEARRDARTLLHLVPASTGLYLLARLSVWADGGLPYGQVLALTGSLAFLVGALLAWVEADRSKILSFVMISQAGYAIASLAVAKPPITLVILWPSLNLVCCLGLLFLSQDRSEPGGLWPTAALGLAMASLAGVPLTLGFVGRWHLYHALLTGPHLALLVLTLSAETFLLATLLKMWLAIYASPPELAHGRSFILVGAGVLAAPILTLGLHPPVLRPLVGTSPLPTVLDLLHSTTLAQWAALSLPLLGSYLLQRHRQSIFDPFEPLWLKLSAVLRLEWLYRLLGQIVAGARGALRIVAG
jgi:formate hydrogenlyase subunit 3/multisubunit Na+/H+ antiporter MnhD subunit